MATPNNFHDIPKPDSTAEGNRHTDSGSQGSLAKQAKLWKPRGCDDVPVATLSRFAVRLIDRVTGKAYSADELLTAALIVPALQGAAEDPARIGVELLPETAIIAENQSLTTAQQAAARGNIAAMNADAPVLFANSGDGISTSGGASDTYSLLDYDSNTYFSFAVNPLDVTSLSYGAAYGYDIALFLEGLPNCTTLDFDNAGFTSLSVSSSNNNVTTLSITSNSYSGTLPISPNLPKLTTIEASNAASLTGLSFTAASVPALANINLFGSGGTNADTDATLASLAAGNLNTMSGAVFQGNGTTGTDIAFTNISSGANTNLVFTRTAASLAQLVVQPTFGYDVLSGSNGGPIGLTVSASTSTGAIIVKGITVKGIAASVINFTDYAYQSKTLSAASYTFTASNAANTRSVKLYLTQSYVGSLSVTWFGGITWAAGAPTFTNGTTTVVTLVATGTNTYTGSFTTSGTAPANTTAADVKAAIIANTNAASMVTVTNGSGVQTGALGSVATTNVGNLAISKLVARGWTISLSNV